MHLVLLPGLDGTGDLFPRFQQALPTEFASTVVRYPKEDFLEETGLLKLIQEAVPEDQDFAIVAESFSGPLAIAFAANPPRNLSALVLCCTYPSNPLPWLLRGMGTLARPRFFQKPLPPYLIRRAFVDKDASEDLVTAVQKAVASVSADVLAQRMRLALRTQVEKRLKQVTVPTLCLSGTEDRILGKHCQRQLRTGLANAQHVLLAGPHLLLQSKAEESAAAIVAFLAGETEGP